MLVTRPSLGKCQHLTVVLIFHEKLGTKIIGNFTFNTFCHSL